MLLEEVKEQVFKLPPSDRLALVSAIIESLQDPPVTRGDRSGAIQRMRGLLKTDQQTNRPRDQQTNPHRQMRKWLQCWKRDE